MKPAVGAAHINRSHPLAQGLMLYWLFNDGAGALARDLVSADAGVRQAGTTWGASRVGRGLVFAPDDATARVWNSRQVFLLPTVTLATRMHVTAWRTGSVAGFADGYASSIHDKVLRFVASKLEWYVFDAGGSKVIADPAITSDGDVFSAVGTADGTTMRLYKNGVGVGSTSAGTTYLGYSVPNFFVGYRGTDGSSGFTVDYVAVWNRAVTPGEVAQLHMDPYAVLVRPRRRPVRRGAAGATPVAATFAAPYEALAGAAQATADPWESLVSLATITTRPYEALVGAQASAAPAWEALGVVAAARVEPWEALGWIASPRAGPWEALGPLSALVLAPWEALESVQLSVAGPWESLVGAAGVRSPAWEALAGALRTLVLPWESQGLVAVVMTAVAPWEALGGAQLALVVSWESLADTRVASALSWEALVSLAATQVAPYEALVDMRREIILPWESQALAAVATIVMLPWEGLADARTANALAWESLTALATPWESPYEALGGVTRAPVLLWEALTDARRMVLLPWEAAGMVGVVLTTVIPWEALLWEFAAPIPVVTVLFIGPQSAPILFGSEGSVIILRGVSASPSLVSAVYVVELSGGPGEPVFRGPGGG